MANRHKKFKKGGRTVYSGAESNVAHEAEEKKHGGAALHHDMKASGEKGRHRIHKKRGGAVGSDKHPFSSAYTASTEAE